MKPRHGGGIWDYEEEVIDFSANINPLGPSKKALKALENWKIEHYPPQEPVKLREAVAEYVGVEEQSITFGNGSIELIRDFCSLYLKDRDRTVILGPTFSEYERFARTYGGDAKYVYPEEGFAHRFEEITETVDDTTRVVFICRPNNPTGSAMPEVDLNALIGFCLEKGIYVFLDEVFIEFSDLKSYAPMVGTYENLFVLRSFTKFFALPGLRVGYGVAAPEIIERLESIKPPWNLNIFAHDAAIASLKDSPYMEKTRRLIQREREFLAQRLRELGIEVYPSHANFLLLRYNWNSRDVKKELLKEGMLIRDCSSFPGLDTRFIRVSIRQREENLKLLKLLQKQAETGVKTGMDCPYYPCHFEGQDCHFCFCPFYPCGDEKRGRLIIGKKGREVWSCKDCGDIHRPEVVRRVLETLGGRKMEALSKKERLAIKEDLMGS